jgi:hypothetical protein
VAILKQIALLPKIEMSAAAHDVEKWLRACHGDHCIFGTMLGIAPSEGWFGVLVWDGHTFEEVQTAYAHMLLEATEEADLSTVIVVYQSDNGEILHE